MSRPFRVLVIENSTYCNGQCVSCVQSKMPRVNKNISMADLNIVLSQMDEIKGSLIRVFPHGQGEPTLHPQYEEMLDMVKSKCRKQTQVINYTNGSMLHKKSIRESMVRNLNRLVISIDGATIETMKLTRPGLDPQKVKDGVELLWKEHEGNGPRICIRKTDMPVVAHENKLFREVWKPYSHETAIVGFDTDFLPDKVKDLRDMSKPCRLLFEAGFVTVDLDFCICCRDVFAEAVVGNLRKNTLKELWDGPMEEMRKLHLEGRSAEIGLCSRCEYRQTYKGS